MEPVDPEITVDGWEPRVYAKSQTEYRPLPALFQRGPKGALLMRWRPTAEELAILLAGDDLYIEIWTFNQSVQPIAVGCWSNKVACVDGGIDESR